MLFALLLISAPSDLAFRALPVLGQNGAFVATATALSKSLFLTNAHVVSENQTIVVQCTDLLITAAVLRVAPEVDLALVELYEPCESAVPNALRTKNAPVGTSLWMIGFPVGHYAVKHGILSQYRAVSSDATSSILAGFTDGQVIPGNSGGPVLDSQGRLIGLVFGRLAVRFPDATTVEGVFVPVQTIHRFLGK